MTATKYGGNSQSLKDEYEASFNTVIAILDEIAKVFKDEKMSFEKYASLLKISFAENALRKNPSRT